MRAFTSALAACGLTLAAAACGGGGERSNLGGSDSPAATGLEKTELRLGFIKLTDMVPLAIALEKGYFEDEGLFVELEAGRSLCRPSSCSWTSRSACSTR